MRAPRQPGPLADPLATDVAYAAATVALSRARDAGGSGVPPWSGTQVAGVAIAAAAPFIARDLLARLDGEPWWRRGRVRRALLAEARARVTEQGVLGG